MKLLLEEEKLNGLPAHVVLMTEDRTPSDHSLVARSNSPYNSPNETALGLIGNS